MLTPTDVHYVVGLLTLISSPDNVEITLGDLVYDAKADENRDVDVTVTYRDLEGLVSVFKGIEVKKHLRPLDVTHVEQLAAKLNDMPLMNHRAIVSASGYTKPAQRKAEAHGMELFSLVDWVDTMEGFDHLKFAPWLTAGQTVFDWVSSPHIFFNSNQQDFAEVNSQVTLATPVCDASGKVHESCPDIKRLCDGIMFNALISIKDQKSIESLPPGTAKNVTINVEIVGEIYALFDGRPLPLKDALVIGQVVKVRQELKPFFKVLKKVGESRPYAGCAIAEALHGSLIGITVSQTDRAVRLIHISLSDRNRKKIQMQKLR